MNYKFEHMINVQNNEFACGTYFVLFKFTILFNKRNSHNILNVQCLIALIIHMQVILILTFLNSHI
jgi:hypothetical protein